MDSAATSESDAIPTTSDDGIEHAGETVDEQPWADTESIDLDRVERDLNDVQAALVRLNDGHYWTDEVTGDALPDQLLADNPTARTVTSSH